MMWWLAMVWACGGSAVVQDASKGAGTAPDVPGVSLAPEVRACVDALEAQRASGTSLDRDAMKRCAEVYKLDGCEAAWKEAAELGGGAIFVTIAEACRRAYCPVLSEPPEICGAPSLDVIGALKGWPPLQRAVFAHDWSPAEAAALTAAYAPPKRQPAVQGD